MLRSIFIIDSKCSNPEYYCFYEAENGMLESLNDVCNYRDLLLSCGNHSVFEILVNCNSEIIRTVAWNIFTHAISKYPEELRRATRSDICPITNKSQNLEVIRKQLAKNILKDLGYEKEEKPRKYFTFAIKDLKTKMIVRYDIETDTPEEAREKFNTMLENHNKESLVVTEEF